MFLSRFGVMEKEGRRIFNPQKCECKLIELKNSHETLDAKSCNESFQKKVVKSVNVTTKHVFLDHPVLLRQYCLVWKYGLASFQIRVTELDRFCTKSQFSLGKLLCFVKRCRNLTFNVKSLHQKFLFFTLNNTVFGTHFLSLIFFDKFNF